MGKLKILFAIIITIFFQKIYGQSYQVSYSIIYKPLVSDTLKVKETYILKFDVSRSESLFISTDSNSSFNAVIYKNFLKNNFYKYEKIIDGNYSISYKLNNQNWKFISESKKILGFDCQKATAYFGGRNWEAWYSTEVPFQDGPYKFSGLPGLIMEIYSLDGDYSFLMDGIENKVHQDILPPKAIPFKNEEVERKYKLEIIKDPASQYRKSLLQLKSQNIGVSVRYNGEEIKPSDTEKRIVEEFVKWINKHDNPIEKGSIWIK